MSFFLVLYGFIFVILSCNCLAARATLEARESPRKYSAHSDGSAISRGSGETTVTLDSTASGEAGTGPILPLAYKPFATIPPFLDSLLNDAERAFLESVTLEDLQEGLDLDKGENIHSYLPEILAVNRDTLLDLGIKYHAASNAKAGTALLFWHCANKVDGDFCYTLGLTYRYKTSPYLPTDTERANFWFTKALDDPYSRKDAEVALGRKPYDNSGYGGTPVGEGE